MRKCLVGIVICSGGGGGYGIPHLEARLMMNYVSILRNCLVGISNSSKRAGRVG